MIVLNLRIPSDLKSASLAVSRHWNLSTRRRTESLSKERREHESRLRKVVAFESSRAGISLCNTAQSWAYLQLMSAVVAESGADVVDDLLPPLENRPVVFRGLVTA